MKNNQIRNSFLLLLTATIWGVAFVAQSVGMKYIGPFTFNFTRSLIGGLVLIPCIAILNKSKSASNDENLEAGNSNTSDYENGKDLNKTSNSLSNENKKKRNELLLGGLCCGFFLCVASCFQQYGIKYTSVGKSGFITALYIVLVPVFGIFLHRKTSPLIWSGVGLALAGLYFLCISGELHIQKGDYMLMICAVLFSIHILVIDYFTQRVDGVKMSCIQFFVMSIICFFAMLIFEKPSFHAILLSWQPILYAGVMSSGVGYTLQIIGQRGMNPAVASLILSLESVVSVIAGFFLLKQTLSGRELFGCALMFVAIILAQLPDQKINKEKAEVLK